LNDSNMRFVLKTLVDTMQLPIVNIETSTITTFLFCFLQRTIVTLLLLASGKNRFKF